MQSGALVSRARVFKSALVGDTPNKYLQEDYPMYANIRGVNIYFDIEGMGLVPINERMVEKRTCFLVHGGPGFDHTGWKPTISPLAEYSQLVYFDHRGNGRSSRGPIDTYTLDNNVEDLEALRDYLGIEEMILLGWSYGGFVAMTYATKYPDRVSHLIALTTSPCFKESRKRAQEIAADRADPVQARHLPALWEGRIESAEHMLEIYKDLTRIYTAWNEPGDPRIDGESLSRAILNEEPLNFAFGKMLDGYDLRSDLNKITAHTLVLAGRYDWITPLDQSKEIARLIPNARLQIFDYSGHFVITEETEKFMRTIKTFLIETDGVPLEIAANAT
jgi:proline iminopeptidase